MSSPMDSTPNLDPVHGYTLTFELRPHYFYALVEGEHDSYEVSRSFWLKVAEHCVKIGAERVMIHENIAEKVSFAEVFQLASEIPSMGFGRAKVAFVDQHLDQQDVNTFGELVAQNRGLNGRVFTDVASAERWLVGNPKRFEPQRTASS
jgi:hypothetical protein